MSKRIKSHLSIAALLVAFLGSMSTTSAQGGGKVRPFVGQASGAIVGQIPPNGLALSYTGNATHLGRFTRDESIQLNPDGSFVGQLVFYAANGDELYAVILGQFTSATTAIGQYQFAGGTGRFLVATGQADFQAVTPDGLHVNVQFNGGIRY